MLDVCAPRYPGMHPHIAIGRAFGATGWLTGLLLDGTTIWTRLPLNCHTVVLRTGVRDDENRVSGMEAGMRGGAEGDGPPDHGRTAAISRRASGPGAPVHRPHRAA